MKKTLLFFLRSSA